MPAPQLTAQHSAHNWAVKSQRQNDSCSCKVWREVQLLLLLLVMLNIVYRTIIIVIALLKGTSDIFEAAAVHARVIHEGNQAV
jgi:hypothetical protein